MQASEETPLSKTSGEIRCLQSFEGFSGKEEFFLLSGGFPLIERKLSNN